MSTENYAQWVSDQQPVVARYAHDGSEHARGRVYAYSDRPTLHIEDENGDRFTWLAELCIAREQTPEEIRTEERKKILRQIGELRDEWIAAANDPEHDNRDLALADSYRSRAWDLNNLCGQIARQGEL